MKQEVAAVRPAVVAAEEVVSFGVVECSVSVRMELKRVFLL